MRENRKKTVRVTTINREYGPEDTPFAERPRSQIDTPVARRFRAILRGYEEEFDITTEAERTLARQAATLTLKSEQLQAELVRGVAVDAGELTRLAGQVRRLPADLKRRAAAADPGRAPSLDDHFHEPRDDEGGE